MTFATRFRAGAAAVVVAGVLATAAPAYAQTDPTPPARLTELKARADQAVKDRLAQIDKLTGRINGAQAALNDMGAKLSDATTHAKQASSSVADLQPDKGDQSVLSANFAALSKGRQDLHTAWSDLQTARRDAHTAIDDLKNLHKS